MISDFSHNPFVAHMLMTFTNQRSDEKYIRDCFRSKQLKLVRDIFFVKIVAYLEACDVAHGPDRKSSRVPRCVPLRRRPQNISEGVQVETTQLLDIPTVCLFAGFCQLTIYTK